MSSAIYNKRLWFLHQGCSGKHYIIGNPHTYPGRMLGWCVSKNRSFFFSKSDIQKASAAATTWIDGFLTGNEPEPPITAEGDVDFESIQYKKWLAQVEIFRNTGAWPAKRPSRAKRKQA